MNLRPATPQDLPAVLTLAADLYAEDGFTTPRERCRPPRGDDRSVSRYLPSLFEVVMQGLVAASPVSRKRSLASGKPGSIRWR